MKTRQTGSLLLEIIAAMAIGSFVVVGLQRMIETTLEDSKSQQAGAFQNRVAQGLSKFVADTTWNAFIKANATTTVPVKVTTANLVAGNFLPAGTQTTNAYRQTACGLIYYDNVAGKINTLLTTEGGDAIAEKQLAYVAASAGDGAGYISSLTPTLAKGAFGNWQTVLSGWTDATAAKNCTGTPAAAGHLATQQFFDATGTLVSDFLYRNSVAGRPDLNTMNTPIIMSAGTVQTVGNACATNGAIARDATGGVVSCVSALWKAAGGSAYWADPVTNFAALPVCNAAAAWQTRVVEVPTIGTGPRAYTCDSANWQPLALNNNGSLKVPGALGVGATSISTVGSACASGAIAQTVSGDVLYCRTDTLTYAQAGNGTIATNNVQITGVVTENTACANGTADNGKVARDTNGLLLSCQSGVWARQGITSGVYTLKITGYSDLFQGTGTYNSSSGTFTGSLICDPATVSTYCGANGHARCGTNASCAWNIAAYSGGTYSTWMASPSYYYRTGAGVADVSALSVNTVTAY